MRTVSLIQFGLGSVGRALVEMVLATRGQQARRGLTLEYVALVDRDGAVVADPGDLPLDEPLLRELCRLKQEGRRLAEHPRGYFQDDLAAIVDVAGRPDTVVVDVTAAEAEVVTPAFWRAQELGYAIVLANKKPLTADVETFRRLTAGPLGYEATVGAGLPVIRTLHLLLDTGDAVQAVRGALSGTLGFIMSEVERGTPFAAAVRQARDLGYTEPDPRDDLNGMDVARKALILARTMGHERTLDEVQVESLVPPTPPEADVEAVLDALTALDEKIARRFQQAEAQGHTLRYIATVTAERLEVGLAEVPRESPLGQLRGPDNLILFETERYTPRPLVIQGPGAGAVVTASAVLADILAVG